MVRIPWPGRKSMAIPAHIKKIPMILRKRWPMILKKVMGLLKLSPAIILRKQSADNLPMSHGINNRLSIKVKNDTAVSQPK